MRVDATVVWINARQQHPVHSLPRGYGVEFRNITADAKVFTPQYLESVGPVAAVSVGLALRRTNEL